MAMGTSNLKFFPHSLDDCSLAITSEASGHEKEFLQDHNKDTYWESTDTSAQNVDFNNGAAYKTDYMVLYHNLPTGTNVRPYGANAANYSDEAPVADAIVIAAGNTPIMVFDYTGVTQAYWRLKITSLSSVAKINLIYAGEVLDVTTMFGFGWLDADRRYDGVDLEESISGKRFGKLIRASRRRWEFNWELLLSAMRTELDNLLIETKGPGKPFIFTDIDGTEYFARAMSPALNVRPPAFEYYNVGPLVIEEEF